MSRPLRVRVAALNITTDPHSSALYVDLLQAAYELNRKVQIAGDLYAALGYFHEGEKNSPSTGEIYRFIDLDPSADWFDLRKRKPATKGELETLKIPEHLKPHLQRLPYVFFPDKHRLIFITAWKHGAMAPSRVCHFFYSLLNDPRLTKQFSPVNVTLEQEPTKLEAIFSLHYLRELQIEIKRPNADTDEGIEKEILDQMRAEHAAKQTVILDAEHNQSLKPSETTKAKARIAVSNGKVVARGRDDQDMARELDTEQHPRIETFDINQDKQPFLTKLIDQAEKWLKKIVK
jgi:hypothetical protein